jgi:pimeloyl-ACP methyl ester carboxylesterase
MPERKLAVIDVEPGAKMESQSGLQMLRPRIYGAYEEPSGRKRTAVIVMHPASNFMGHYLITPLARRGIGCLGLNSRYAGNDAVLWMERVIQDLGAGVKFMRSLGYDKVLLFGNSGGAALSAFYQAEAERLTVQATPAGDPVPLTPEDLPPVQGIALGAAHAGRSRLFLEWLDPSVIDEHEADLADPALDVYNVENGPPYAGEWLARFRAGQAARRDRIEAWVWARLRALRAQGGDARDQAFVIHRTHADPRFLDLTLDANDRPRGSIWGDPREVNYAANAMGRYTTLTAFLSQWASCSQADGPTNLARTSVPVLFLEYTADASTFPSTAKLWLDAAGTRAEAHRIVGGNHYLARQADRIEQVAEIIDEWAGRI